MKFPVEQKFKLTEGFLEKYNDLKPPFGFNGLGEFVFMRTYSRKKPDGSNESWQDVVKRVVEGIYSIQKQHIEDYRLGWNQAKAQKSAQIMYDKIFNMKFLPAGRSLWAMGTPLIMEKGLTEALYNCSALSTENIKDDVGLIFANAMDFLMCGIGVGADTKGKNTVEIKQPKERKDVYVIPDSREGWVESLKLSINAFFGGPNYEFDYSEIRAEGEPIRGFGGTSSGYKPLKELHDNVYDILSKNVGNLLSERNIVDIFNFTGKAVVAGNVRRSAEIMLGEPTEEFLDLKNYDKNPDRAMFGWASNNTVYATLGMDYSDIAERISTTGEPGLAWFENVHKYGRMNGVIDTDDAKATLFNPCGEIGLEHGELCNLAETFPTNHDTVEEYISTLKYAYLYAKTVTLLGTNWVETNRVMLRNRRVGLSMTGIVQAIEKHGISKFIDYMEKGYNSVKHYDEIYSDWFAVPKSIRLTTAKPSGTLSLLAGATPGVHYPESKYYIRRVRLGKDSPFVDILQKAGYKIEDAFGQEDSTVVVEFPVYVGEVKTINDVTMWEQLALAALIQKYWADNSVSVTITFKENEKKDLTSALNLYQYQLKDVSFLPKLESGAYPQMPYEEISKETYEKMLGKVKPVDFSTLYGTDGTMEKFCNDDGCTIL